MWFESAQEIAEIASKTGTAVFVMPPEVTVEIPGAIFLQPEDKTVITIEQIRRVTARLGLKQVNDQFVVVRPADQMGLDAANAFLKNLEEPGDKVHFILITDRPSRLLPTILSRAVVYFWRDPKGLNLEITADAKTKELAKKMLNAKGRDLVEIAEQIAKKKAARAYALEILGVAIEMLYKSYLINGKEALLKKLPKFLVAYENILKNGHVKLQIVANLC